MKVSLDGGPIYLLSANCEQYKCIECSVNAIRPCIQPISASFCLHFKCNFDFLGLNSAYLKSTWHCLQLNCVSWNSNYSCTSEKNLNFGIAGCVSSNNRRREISSLIEKTKSYVISEWMAEFTKFYNAWMSPNKIILRLSSSA